MKRTYKILVMTLFSTIFCYCSSSSLFPNKARKVFDYKNISFIDRCLQYNKNRAIRKSIKKSDTLYLYSVAFSNWGVLWYHSDNHIYSCAIYPYKIQWYEPIEAENFKVDSANLELYFGLTFYRDIQCFEDAFDGESVSMIINGRKSSCSVNTECLFSNEFPVGSFPRKLQYDLSRVLSNSNRKKTPN